MLFPCSHVSDFRTSEALEEAPSDASNGAPVERARAIRRKTSSSERPVQFRKAAGLC
jgi:hypothetical protein